MHNETARNTAKCFRILDFHFFFCKVSNIFFIMALFCIIILSLSTNFSPPLYNHNADITENDLSHTKYSPTRRDLKCVQTYIHSLRKLDTISGDFNFYVDAIEKSMSQELSSPIYTREIILGVGSGSTATHGLAGALWKMGFDVAHFWHRRLGPKALRWHETLYSPIITSAGKENISLCHKVYANADFRYPRKIDAILDTPMAELFWDFYRTYPNAKYILTFRNATQWFLSRTRDHWQESACLYRPCGLKMKHFSGETHAKLFLAHNDFVRCIVPKERLLTLCFNCHNVTWKMVGDFVGRNPRDFGFNPDKIIPKISDLDEYDMLQHMDKTIECIESHGKKLCISKNYAKAKEWEEEHVG